MALKVAIVGATGAVGRELLALLESRKFPVGELIPFASERSRGKPVRLNGRDWPCRVMEKGCFQGVDMAFFDASDAISKEWAPQAAEAGAWVIDNSATYRMESDIPLVVPEVNGELVRARARPGRQNVGARERIFAGPNCSTVQLVLPLKALHQEFGLKRVVVSSYQSVSGAGTAAMDELSEQSRAFLAEGLVPSRIQPKAFAHQIAFNCIPQIGGFKEDGYTSEERKIMEESRKILGIPALRISATAVRVPTYSCHGESVNVECLRPVSLTAARAALKAQAGVSVLDDPAALIYPMNVTQKGDPVPGGTGQDAVYVGRVRQDPSVDNGLNLWIVSDNLRKGAALNAIQVGELLLS